jgi:hypothetical protein
MSVGGRLLASCCANGGLSNNQIPTCPFTTISLQYTNTNTFVTGVMVYVSQIISSDHPGCDFSQFDAFWDSDEGGINSYTLNNVGTGNARWDLVSTTIVSAGAGPVVRPGTNTIIGFAPTYKHRSLTFNRTSRFRSRSNGVNVGGQTTYDAGGCCSSSVFQFQFDDFVTPPVINETTPNSPATYSLQWVGVASERGVGLTLVLTASGIAAGPWVIEVSGGTLSLTNGSGSTTSHTGLLTTVVTAINAAGFFTATLGLDATTVCETQDLKVSKSNPISTNCTYSLYNIEIGDEIAPGSFHPAAGVGFPTRLFSPAPFFFDLRFNAAAEGLPNNAAGLETFMRRVWFPKLNSTGGVGTLQAVSNSYMGVTGARWSTTAGTSSLTYTANTNDTRGLVVDTYSTVCIGCITGTPLPEFSPCDSFPSASILSDGISPGQTCSDLIDCSGSPLGLFQCDCAGPPEWSLVRGWVKDQQVTITDAPVYTGTETISGRFELS